MGCGKLAHLEGLTRRVVVGEGDDRSGGLKVGDGGTRKRWKVVGGLQGKGRGGRKEGRTGSI